MAKNRILAGLDPAEYERLKPHLTPVGLDIKFTFCVPNQDIDVHFPLDLVGSVLQVAGGAVRMRADVMRREPRNGQLGDLTQRYTLGFMTQVSQGTACNRAHSAEERMARWLLIVQDRVGRDEFTLTQEFMSQMLGVRRATVSATAGGLQSAGLISYTRGNMKIENRAGLEQTSCECYQIVRNEFERLLGVPVG